MTGGFLGSHTPSTPGTPGMRVVCEDLEPEGRRKKEGGLVRVGALPAFNDLFIDFGLLLSRISHSQKGVVVMVKVTSSTATTTTTRGFHC